LTTKPSAIKSPFKQPIRTEPEEDPNTGNEQKKTRKETKDYTVQIAAGVGALIVLGAIWLFFSSKAEKRFDAMVVEAMVVLEKAQKQAKDNEFQKAKSTYKEFLNDPRFNDYPKDKREAVKEALSKVEKRIDREEDAQRILDPILSKAKNADKEQFPDIIEDLIKFIKDYGETTSAQKATDEVSKLRQKQSEEKKGNANELFAKVRVEADELINKGDPAGALEKYRAFTKEYPDMAGPLKNKINNEMKAVKKLIADKK